ncbi:hypothetical protein PAECIP111891_03778 [Paenibacillus allorhizoplanae]|uniref:Transposase n=1 Tax=Paenibacillus allorhizoplanae TaxID=2905648 RepID=A0ABM9CF55_9BACL|nr:hypothetical protein [Paenibacillus allorhizoplanae]CAH1211913.1 hypothetical protein PAECIP111891_03778 [Paenibacillus allorhizoplanae]
MRKKSHNTHIVEGLGFLSEDRRVYTDLETVESQRNDMIPEEFPEGPYGTSMLSESLGKSTPWREDQRPTNRFAYENRELHEGISRDYPGADDALGESTEGLS